MRCLYVYENMASVCQGNVNNSYFLRIGEFECFVQVRGLFLNWGNSRLEIYSEMVVKLRTCHYGEVEHLYLLMCLCNIFGG